MATIEKRYLPPINPGTTINEADRTRVYDIIRRHLADMLTGDQSYHPESPKKPCLSVPMISGISGNR